MLISDIFRLSTRMFRRNAMRTLLTILGIGVGIGTILFLVSLGYGLQQLILNQITTSDSLLSLDVTTGDVEGLRMDEQSLNDIKTLSEIDKVTPLVSLQAQIKSGGISSELTANFAEREYFTLEGKTLKNGDFYSDNPEDAKKVIISLTALQLFNISEEDALGKELTISVYVPEVQGSQEGSGLIKDYTALDGKFKIVGIIEEEGSNYIYLPYANTGSLSNITFSKIKVKVKSEDELNIARNKIIEKGFIVSALSDIIEQANQIFRVVQIVLGLFGVVALVVSAIGMFNTMTIALLERTQEIGIMKAMGASDLDIWNMFLGESFIMGFLGGVGGIIIGILTGKVFNYGLNFLAGAMGGEKIDLFYTPLWFILLIAVFSTIVGLATGFYPASRAAKINCLEALRYK